jgi:polysaccharide chain length determinant protein (PEP-CTERM system associated)
MTGGRELQFSDYISIVRRRLWVIVIPTLILPVLAYLVSLKIPNKYTSETLVLVEQQRVPGDFVRPVVSDELNQRLTTMREEILSRSRLEPIMTKYSLYKRVGEQGVSDEALERLRNAISVTPVKPEYGSRNGIPGFYITFTWNNPYIAQQVCSDIASLFMEENLKDREQTAEGTTQFLSSQLDTAKKQMDQQDSALATFKAQYFNQLPGRDETNLAMLSSLNQQMAAVTQTITQSEQQKTYLQSMLTQQLAAWRNRQADGGGDPGDLQKRRTVLEAELLSLQARYTEDHPDVIKAKNALAQIDRKINDAGNAIAANKAPVKSPSAIEPNEIAQVRMSIRQIDDSIANKKKEQDRIQREIGNYQSRIQLSPMVEEQYKKLTRDYQTAQAFYDDLLSKKRQSEMAAALEKQQKGQKFRVMDAPNLPQQPTSPNRLMFVLGGLVAGLAVGGGGATVLEMKDQSLRTEQDVIAALKLPILASIPNVVEDVEKEAKEYKKALAGV